MKKMILAAATAMGLMAIVPANAGTYTVSYRSSFPEGGTANFSGVLTTTDAANTNGFLTVTSLTGTRNGLAASLSLTNSFGGNDNLFKPTPNYVNTNGFTYSADGAFYNVYFDGLRYREFGVGSLTNFSVSAVTAAVPEPASWAMMIGGFGVVGGAMRRKRKVNTTVAFA